MYGVIDVGTTGVKLSVFTKSLERVHFEKVSIGFEKVGSGLVEQDSFKLAEVVKGYAKKAKSLGAKTIGLCTYRASVLAWKKGGKPLSNIITWIDGRGKSVVERLPFYAKLLRRINKKLRFIINPDSPAVLLKWLYDNIKGLKESVERGEAYAWTLDSYLLHVLGGGYYSDITSSAMTGLIHPETGRRIDIVYSLLGLPRNNPEIVENVHDFGQFEDMGVGVSIADQQAAAVGLGVLRPGEIESVHGTGSFVEEVTDGLVLPGRGLLPIVILALDGWKVYGVEGFIRTTGSIVDWLMKNGFFEDYGEIERPFSRRELNSIVLPTFGGIKTPRHADVRGVIVGLGLDTEREDILAGLAWGVALHVALIVRSLERYAGSPREPMWTAGGFSRSDGFLQILADATGIRVARIRDVEASSLGVAKLLAYRDGVISRDELGLHPDVYRVFVPSISDEERTRLVEVYESLLESYLTASCLSRSSC